jgi:hypothetical protein
MELKLIRYSSGTDDTNGILMNEDDCTCLAMTIEDEYRKDKVMHETRIPAGRYQIKLRNEGGKSEKYRKRHNDPNSKYFVSANFHQGMLCIFNKPNWVLENSGKKFQYILIHSGNDDDDTSGCLLVGDSATLNRYGKDGFVGNSIRTYMRIYPIIRDMILRGNEVWLTVENIG